MSNLLVIIGIFAFFSIISGVPGAYRALYVCLGILLLILWGLRENSKKISFRTDLSRSSGFPGNELFLQLKLKNSSWFPVFWCMVSMVFAEPLGAHEEQALLTIVPGGQVDCNMRYSATRRGIYPVPDTRLTFGDPWGFKEINITHQSTEKVTIYPPISPVLGLDLIRHLPLGRHQIRFGLHEDPSRLRGCRDYQSGDSIKRVHWPNTARTGMLKVKDWETTLTAENGIFLNLGEDEYPVKDWFGLSEMGIEFAASLVHRLITNRETLGFYCNGKSCHPGQSQAFIRRPKHGNQQEKGILEYLAGVQLDKDLDFKLLFHEAHQLSGGSCLLFITPLITLAMVERVRQLLSVGYHPIFIWLKSVHTNLPVNDLKRAKIPYFAVERREDHHVFLVTRKG